MAKRKTSIASVPTNAIVSTKVPQTLSPSAGQLATWKQWDRFFEDRLQNGGRQYRETVWRLSRLCVLANLEGNDVVTWLGRSETENQKRESERDRTNARMALFHVADVEARHFIQALPLDRKAINKYCPPLAYAAYVGMIWEGERIAQVLPTLEPMNALSLIVAKMHTVMEAVWEAIRVNAVASTLPEEVRKMIRTIPRLPEEHRKQILAAIVTSQLAPHDRALLDQVARFVERHWNPTKRVHENTVPDYAWQQISLILSLRRETGMSLEPGTLKKRYQRLTEKMQEEHERWDRITQQAMAWSN